MGLVVVNLSTDSALFLILHARGLLLYVHAHFLAMPEQHMYHMRLLRFMFYTPCRQVFAFVRFTAQLAGVKNSRLVQRCECKYARHDDSVHSQVNQVHLLANATCEAWWRNMSKSDYILIYDNC